MKSNQIKKTLIHFDTINNLNATGSPYNNCNLKINESYKNVHSISLKSAELQLPSNVIPNNCNYIQMYRPVTSEIETKLTLTNYYFDFSELINFSIGTLIEKINTVVNVPNDDGSYLQFYVGLKGTVTVRFFNFYSLCYLLDSPLLRLLGMTNQDQYKTGQYNLGTLSYAQPIGTVENYFNIINNKIINGLVVESSDIYTNFFQQIDFLNIATVQYRSNVFYLYFSNLPIKSTSAFGNNYTFKIPLSNMQDSGTSGINCYFYNEQSNYKQQLEFNDSHFIFNNIIVSLYNKYGNIQNSTPINYTFSIEIEYE